MKKFTFFLLLTVSTSTAFAQQYSLYNSRTLYDSFENPSQKAFYADSSRKFAFNFFIPTVGVNAAVTGPAQAPFKSFIFENRKNADNLVLGQNLKNTATAHTNTYIVMFRIFNNIKYNSEMGLSWQVRNDGQAVFTNETFAVFNNYRLFNPAQSVFSGAFNNNFHNQAYHQISFSYREDYNERLGLGAKVSLLSGIAYNSLEIKNSYLTVDQDANEYLFGFQGTYRSNFQYNNTPETVFPDLYNPGASVSLSANYKFKKGWYVLGNLKDIGFIKWNKNSFQYNLTGDLPIPNASSSDAGKRLSGKIGRAIIDGESQTGYNTLVNGKADILLNKDFNSYQPNLILSKNLFYPGGDIALINNYLLKNYVFTLSTAYKSLPFGGSHVQLGGQLMIKSPNVEFFAGSDQALKTVSTVKNAFNESSDAGNGYTGGSFYLGFALKFGRVMEHQANSNTIPGIGSAAKGEGGFFKRLLAKKSK